MSDRNVDAVPDARYTAMRNEAANAYVRTQNPDGNTEGLALKQAFQVGANTSLQFPQNRDRIVQAVLMGRQWGLAEEESDEVSETEEDPDLYRKSEIEDEMGRD